jgi:TolB-like protein
MTEASANPTTLGHDVFVSYASQDASIANSIVENLETQGIKCWIAPRDVKPGSQYADAIVRAINDAKAVVLVMSASAVGSSHVGKEIERASSKRKPIVAFRIDAAPLNHALEYFLSESQWIDVKALGMPAALAKLKEAVGQGPATLSSQAVPMRPTQVVGRRLIIPGAIVVALGVAIAVGVHLWGSKQGAPAPAVAAITDKSIAVLPFVDMSEKKDQEYFADGMAEEIIDLLVKVPGLKIISRTSSFQFRGKTEDLRSIAKQLGVAYVLEGSIRKSGDRLRVTAQLIDSRDGSHLLSQTYDRDLSDILKMQDEIAAKVVRALQIEVGADGLVSRPPLHNAEAYTLYLQGRHAFDRLDRQGLEQAMSDFQRALDLDPTFAAAASELGDSYFLMGAFGLMPSSVAVEQARKAAALALKLDPNYAGAHALLGSIHDLYDWDWAAADRELKLARSLVPNDAHVLLVSAAHSQTMGGWDDALRLANACLEQSPLDPLCSGLLSQIQLSRGQLAEAEAAARRTLEISPTFRMAHGGIGNVLLARGQPNEALTEYSKQPFEGARLRGSAMAYFALGRKADSDTALAQLLNSPHNDSFAIAEIYGFRGEVDDAFKWLERAYAQRATSLSHIKGDLNFKNLEGDPRYKAFLKKMNLPE